LLYTRLESIVVSVNLNGIINFLLCLVDYSFQITVNALNFFTPALVLQGSIHSCFALIIIDVILYNFDVDFVFQSLLSIFYIGYNFKIGIGQI